MRQTRGIHEGFFIFLFRAPASHNSFFEKGKKKKSKFFPTAPWARSPWREIEGERGEGKGEERETRFSFPSPLSPSGRLSMSGLAHKELEQDNDIDNRTDINRTSFSFAV